MELPISEPAGVFRLGRPLLGLLAVIAVGTLGCRLIEGWSWFDALYLSVVTVGTIGFGELYPLPAAGRLCTMGLIAVGLAVLWYTLRVLVGLMVDGRLSRGESADAWSDGWHKKAVTPSSAGSVASASKSRKNWATTSVTSWSSVPTPKSGSARPSVGC